MYIQIVTFHLEGLSEAQYAQACEQQFVSAFHDMPGLISKVWLSNSETNEYGGVYTWRDQAAMEAYKRSELFQSLLAHPLLRHVTSREYGVMESPTRMTRGWAAAAA